MPAPAASTAAPASASRSAASSRTCSAARSSCAARPGIGSTFTLYLPLKYVGPSAAIAPATGARSRPAIAAALAGVRLAELPVEQIAGRPRRSAAGRRGAADRRGRSALRAHHGRSGARQRASRCWSRCAAPTRWRWRASTSRRAVSLDVFLPDMLGWTVLSQLKQDPATRHIPVQIVTLDEDRQHGLARGAFSFVHQADDDGGPRGRARRASRTTPSRGASACWSSRTTRPSGSSIAELLGHDDIDIVTVGTGAEALDAAARASTSTASCSICGCRTCRASRCSSRSATTPALSRRAGRRLHRPRAVAGGGRAAAHDGAQRRGQGRRIAGAAARRDGALPAPGRRRSAGREAAHARAAAQLRRGSRRQARCCWSTTMRATSSR